MKKNVKLGSYIVEKENGYLKVSHENRSWNFRLTGTPENTAEFFENCKEEDKRKYYEIAFANIQIFTILGMQSPQYVEAWVEWHNSYFNAKAATVSPEENEVIVAEEQALYDMKEQAEVAQTETNKTAE